LELATEVAVIHAVV